MRNHNTWIEVPAGDVVALFEQNYKRGPWPSEMHCYHLANAIAVVRNHDLPPVKNAVASYRRRRKAFEAITRLVEEQIKTHYPWLRLPGLVHLEQLQVALEAAKDELLAPANPLAGERHGAEWHWPARYLARYAEEAVRAANHKKYRNKKVSRAKGGPFVLVVCGALELAGLKRPEPEAVAAVLTKSPL